MREIDVFIQGEGLGDILVASAAPSATIAEVLGKLEHPMPNGEGFLIFIEDLFAPIDADAVIEELLPLGIEDAAIAHPLRLHITRCRQVEVAVRFNGEEVKRRFAPGATIARVHHWAARRAFHLSPRDAAEHVLQIQGSTTRPDRDVHIGTLTEGKTCFVAFDLVPRKRVEG